MRRLSRSTLFPYTTLFRSPELVSIATDGETFGHHHREGAVTLARVLDALRQRERDGALDRKSTRLNSSHSQISYAVICLKKNRTPPRCTLLRICTHFFNTF